MFQNDIYQELDLAHEPVGQSTGTGKPIKLMDHPDSPPVNLASLTKTEEDWAVTREFGCAVNLINKRRLQFLVLFLTKKKKPMQVVVWSFNRSMKLLASRTS